MVDVPFSSRAVALMFAGLLLSGAASPLAADPTYCSASALLSKSDVTFRGSKADDCYGVVSGNNPSNASALGLWGGGWDVDIRDEGSPGTKSYQGLSWTLDAPQDVKRGNWTLSVSGAAFPITVDLVAVLKGATSWAAYLFTAETFTQAGTSDGTFALKFANGGGKIPDLSHMDVYLRGGAPTTVPDGDGSVALMLGLGMLAVGLARRRSVRASV